MLAIGDQVLLRRVSGAFPAVVCDVTRAAAKSATVVAVRLGHNVLIRDLEAGEAVIVKDAAGKTWRGLIGGSTDQAIGIVLDEPQDETVEESAVRFELLWRAKLAQRFNKFDDMLCAVNMIGKLHLDLSPEEVNLTLSCYKSLVQNHSRILKALGSTENSEYLAQVPGRVVLEFRQTVECLLQKDCSECIMHVEDHIIPYSSEENRGRFYKLIGDLALMSYDFSSGQKKDMLAKAIGAYEMGIDVMKNSNFPPSNVTLLSLILNLSYILHDYMESHYSACTIASKALSAASLDSVNNESMSVLKLIDENLRTWLSNASPEQVDLNALLTSPQLQVYQGVAAIDQNQVDAAGLDHHEADSGQEITNAQVHQNLADAAAEVNDNHQAIPNEATVLQNVHAAAVEVHHEADPVEEIPNAQVHQNLADAAAEINDNHQAIPNEAAVLQNVHAAAVEVHHHEAEPVEEIPNAQVHQNLLDAAAEVNDNHQGPLHVQAIANEALMDHHHDQFEDPPMYLEQPGNTYMGKKYRNDRKKKAGDRSRYG